MQNERPSCAAPRTNSVGHAASGGLSDSKAQDIRGVCERAGELVHRFLDRMLAVSSRLLGIALNLLRGSVGLQAVGTDSRPDSLLGLADHLVGDTGRLICRATPSHDS